MQIYNHNLKSLEHYEKKADSLFWNSLWDKFDLEKALKGAKREIRIIIKKYIQNTDNWVLESGCGMGQYVNFIDSQGLRVIGIDFALETLQRTKKIISKLNLICGNALQLPFKDKSVGAILSFGVIEHFKNIEYDGVRLVEEMSRILKPGGYLFISFPYMSPLRKMKAHFNLYPTVNHYEQETFYQYALDRSYVQSLLIRKGFRVIQAKHSGGIKGAKDEIPILRYPLEKLHNYKGSSYLLRGFRYLLDIILSTAFAHNILLICILEDMEKH